MQPLLPDLSCRLRPLPLLSIAVGSSPHCVDAGVHGSVPETPVATRGLQPGYVSAAATDVAGAASKPGPCTDRPDAGPGLDASVEEVAQ